MAELALPILALGGLYIYSNSDKKDKSEKFTNMGVTRFNDRGLSNLPNTNVLNKNFPKQDQPIDRTNENYIREFPNSNQTTDKFFNTDISQKLVPPDLRNKEFNSIFKTIYI